MKTELEKQYGEYAYAEREYHNELLALRILLMQWFSKNTSRNDIKDFALEIGFWECLRSPIEVCIYDTSSDSAKDICLICGHPEERK